MLLVFLYSIPDEISTGLDSATTRDVISILRAAADELGLVIVVALLQPPPEVFELFDRVMLMRDGCIVYHGASMVLISIQVPCRR